MDDRINILVKQLEDDSADPNDQDAWIERRINAAKELGMKQSPAAFEPLVRVLRRTLSKKEELSLSWYVIDAMGQIGDKRAIPEIQALLTHWDIDVRKSARRALSHLEGGT